MVAISKPKRSPQSALVVVLGGTVLLLLTALAYSWRDDHNVATTTKAGDRAHEVNDLWSPATAISSHVTTSAGLSMPRMLYGTAWKEENTKKLVLKALRNGFKGFDTAAQPKHYNEAGAGDALAAFLDEQSEVTRQDLFVQTKFNRKHAPTLVSPDATIAEQVAASVQASLDNLQTDYVDSLVMHSPYPDMEDTLEAWKAMEAAVDRGQAKQLGISNVPSLRDLQHLYQQARIKPAVVQMRFYHKTRFEQPMRKWCKEVGMHFQSYWTLTANSKAGANAIGSRVVRKMAQKYGVSPQVMFYRWVMDDGITCPLNGTGDRDHMKEDLEVFQIPLTKSDSAAISEFVYRRSS